MNISTNQFSYTADDVIRSTRIAARGEMRKQRMLAIGALALLVLIVLPLVGMYAVVAALLPDDASQIWGRLLDSWARWGWLAALPAGSILGRYQDLLLWPGRVRRAMEKDPRPYTDVRLTFGDEGMGVSWQHAEAHYEWGHFDSVLETADYFLLMVGENHSTIPKRAFAAPDLPAVGAMLRDRIAKFERLN